MITLRVGDTGTQFIAKVVDEDGNAIDLSPATTKEFVFKKPDGAAVTLAASFVGTGADGYLKYTTLAATLDQPGTWYVQAHVILPSGEWRTEKAVFTVEPNL